MSRQRSVAAPAGVPPVSRDWLVCVAAGAILVVASLLRFYKLGAQELWLDEAFAVFAASRFSLDTLAAESNPPLYYLVLKTWIYMFGDSEIAVRALSAVSGVLTVGVSIALGWVLFGRAAGLWTGLFVAVAPMHVYYSQEARSYALLILLLMLSYLILWYAARRNTVRLWLLFGVCAVLALYTHYFAALGLLATPLLMRAAAGDAAPWRRYVATISIAVMLVVPWTITVLALGLVPEDGHAWIRDVWARTPPGWAIPKSLAVFGIGSEKGFVPLYLKQFTALRMPDDLRFLGLLGFAVVLLFALSGWKDRRATGADDAAAKWFAAAALFLPLAILWAGSFVVPYYAVGRYDMLGFAGYAFLVGLGLGKFHRIALVGRQLVLLPAVVMLIAIGAKLHAYYTAPAVSFGFSARAAGQALHRYMGMDDLIVYTGSREAALAYSLARLRCVEDGPDCRIGEAAFLTRRFMLPHDSSDLILDIGDTRRRHYVLEEIRAELRAALSEVRLRDASVWIAFGPRRNERGGDAERMLLAELGRSGFRSADTPPELREVRVFRFQRR